MFTPEYIVDDKREIVLVSCHRLDTEEAVAFSLAYNRARIANGRPHLPVGPWRIRLFYDLRGQVLPGELPDRLVSDLSDVASVEFLR